MKKIYLLLSLATLSFAFPSCQKCDLFEHHAPVVTNQSVDASVAENTTYTYTLPAMAKGVSLVTGAAAHASTSTLTIDANGNSVYNYTPVPNYTGSDVVVINTHRENANAGGGCFGGGPGGNCNHSGNCGHHNGNDDQTIITTIHLTVTPSSDNGVAKVAAGKALIK